MGESLATTIRLDENIKKNIAIKILLFFLLFLLRNLKKKDITLKNF